MLEPGRQLPASTASPSSAPRALDAFLVEAVARFHGFTPEGKVLVENHLRGVPALHANVEKKSLPEVRAAAENSLNDPAGEILNTALSKIQELGGLIHVLHTKAINRRKARVDQVLKMRPRHQGDGADEPEHSN